VSRRKGGGRGRLDAKKKGRRGGILKTEGQVRAAATDLGSVKKTENTSLIVRKSPDRGSKVSPELQPRAGENGQS